MSSNEAQPTRRQVLAGAAAVGAGAVVGTGLLSACGTETGGKADEKRQQQLFIAGFQWGPPPNFNPLSPTAGWPCGQNHMQLVYEALFGFDVLDGSLKPALGASLEQPDPKTIVVKLQPGATWQDGKPVTADDVVFTYTLGKNHTEVPFAPAWEYLASVTATDAQTVTFALSPERANPGMTKTNLCQIPILPKHLWEGFEKANPTIGEFKNETPVGSGPYKLTSKINDQVQVAMERHENYWGKAAHGGKAPAPKFIVHPIFKDNASGDLAFERGNVDVMQQFTPQIWKMWQDKKLDVGTWYDHPPYHIPGGIPMLVLNTTKPGLNNAKLRLAIAHSIDYARIAKLAMSEYSVPANSSAILPEGAEGQYFDRANVAANGWTYDPAKGKQILEQELGAKKVDGTWTLSDGTKLPQWKVQTPTGWTDWQSALNIVVECIGPKGLGLDVVADFPQQNQVTDAVQGGSFDIAIWYVSGASPGTPWQRLRDVLDVRGITSRAYYNYGRFSHPQVPALLDKAATATGADLKATLTQLDTIFMQNAPMIPLMYRPLEFFEFNQSVWEGFPTEKNSKGSPMFIGAGVRWLYEIAPKS